MRRLLAALALTGTLALGVAAPASAQGFGQTRVPVCHLDQGGLLPDGTVVAPHYVPILVASPAALGGHARHGDVLPYPDGSCPSAVAPPPVVPVPAALVQVVPSMSGFGFGFGY